MFVEYKIICQYVVDKTATKRKTRFIFLIVAECEIINIVPYY